MTHTWSLLNNGSGSPSARYGHSAVAVNGGMLIFGGIIDNNGNLLNDAWSLEYGKLRIQ